MSQLIGRLAKSKIYGTSGWGVLYTCPPGKIACLDIAISPVSVGTNGQLGIYYTPIDQTTRPDDDLIFICSPTSRVIQVAKSILISENFKLSFAYSIGSLSTINLMAVGIEEDLI